MSDQKSSYRSIMKATSLFGGVQVFNIIITIIRSKFVAVLLGPEGMGIAGLLRSAIQIIGQLTNMGIGVSAVKNVAAASASNDQERIATTVTVLRRLVWATGLLGLVITFFLAPWLSKITFGNYDYTIAFRWLSINFLLGQISSGQMVLLQGLRKLQYLAKANILGSVLGLIITIPIYYVWGIDGIVPVMIITSIMSLILSFYFSNKIKIIKKVVSNDKTLKEGKNMIAMGVMISLGSLLTMLEAYLVRIYMSNTGDLSDVGMYNAGFAIIGTYVGMVFTAMGTDYYPRLSEVASNLVKTNKTVNQQAEIAILILAPILTLFLIFINWIVILLYSTKFLPVTDMIHWAALGIFFKAATWATGFIFLAKGDTKWFFWSELVAIIYVLILNLLGYTYFGLEGLGISFLIAYVIGFIQNLIVTNWLYSFKFDSVFYKLFGILFGIALISFWVSITIEKFWMYGIGLILILISTVYSYNELNKRLDLVEVIAGFKNKYLKK